MIFKIGDLVLSRTGYYGIITNVVFVTKEKSMYEVIWNISDEDRFNIQLRYDSSIKFVSRNEE